jgi:PAS domain-containing protein
MSGTRIPAEAGGEATATDPLAAVLPLLRALPTPAVLYRPDGTVAGASAALQELVGVPVDGMSDRDLAALFQIRFPTGRELGFDALCRDVREQQRSSIATDIRDSSGKIRALIASAAAVRSEGKTIGIVVLLFEVTELLPAYETARR